LLNLLIRINKNGHAQFIIATHSPFLMACPDSLIYTFDNKKIEPITYKDTQYYKLYKKFMNNPGEFIKEVPI
ncbi:MAG: AAA family ATPase, partial [Desulfobacteraceae bacterium]|nr:AAA family ATPase [Desulfobacteraceae bacterium]